MAKKYFFTDYVPEGYEQIGGKLRLPLRNFLGYITRYTRHDATYTNVGYKPLSLDRFAKELKMSKSTAQEFIALLEAKGYVEVERGGTYDKENNRYNANRFRLANQYAALVGLNNTQDMEQEQQQPAPTVENIDYKKMYEDCKKMYDSLVARFQKWITDLSGMDSGKDGGKYIEEAVAHYRNRKDSNGQPDEEKNALQARLDKANQWKNNLGGKGFIEAAVKFYHAYEENNGQPVDKLQEENKQLKAEVEKLRKCLDASLQKETPQEQHDAELQKYKNSLDAATNKIKAKDARIGELENRLNNRDSERDKAFDEMYKRAIDAEQHIKELKEEVEQQKLVHEEKIEKLTESIRNKDGAIKILQNDLKKARTGESILITEEPSTPYGVTVKKIQYS